MYVEKSSIGYLNLYTNKDTTLTHAKFSGEVNQEIAELVCEFWMNGWRSGLNGLQIAELKASL
jgi:hypothetical protein